jgi:NitT/TauT family transport system ATP-binding protein
MDKSCISIRQVDKKFETRSQTIHALSDIDLEVRPNEFITFVGASGCGKSTLLRILAGLCCSTSSSVVRSSSSPIPSTVSLMWRPPAAGLMHC